MTQSFNLQQGLKTAKILIREKDFPQALKILNELLEIKPDNKKFLKLLYQTRKKWDRAKKKIVQKSLKKSEILWQRKDYDHLLKIYQRLDEFLPGQGKVEKGLMKLREIFNSQRKEEEQEFIEKSWQKIQTLWRAKNYKDVIKGCSELLEVNPDNLKVIKLEANARKKFVNQHLGLRKSLLKKKDYHQLMDFYKQLLKIDPHHRKLRRLIFNCEVLLTHQAAKNKQKETEEEIGKIKILCQEGKYEEAIEKCQEILQMDAKNRKIEKLLQKIALKDNQITEKKLVDQMINASKKIRKDYLVNKERYIRI